MVTNFTKTQKEGHKSLKKQTLQPITRLSVFISSRSDTTSRARCRLCW